MVTMLRVLISDLDNVPVYSDARLQQVLVVAAQYVKKDINFNQYTINIGTPNISPDPTLDPNIDDVYTNFVVLKGACYMDQSTFRTKALLEGLTSRCGPATLAVVGNLRGYKELLEVGPCKAYDVFKYEYLFGNPPFRTILGPFVGNLFDPAYSIPFFVGEPRYGR